MKNLPLPANGFVKASDPKARLQIEHIVHPSELDLTKPEDQRLCYHYTNLRPGWMNVIKEN